MKGGRPIKAKQPARESGKPKRTKTKTRGGVPIAQLAGSLPTELLPVGGRGARRDVIGNDDRKYLSEPWRYPYSAVAQLIVTHADGSAELGTGFVVGPRMLLTAAHCLYRDGQFATRVEVCPARSGSKKPFGTFLATKLLCASQYLADEDSLAFDYGAVIVDRPVAPLTGSLTVRAATAAEIKPKSTVSVVGYAIDKNAHAPVWAQGSIESAGARLVAHTVDTEDGQSGAPVLAMVNGALVVVAIHAHGTGHEDANQAVRISPDVIATVKAWMKTA